LIISSEILRVGSRKTRVNEKNSLTIYDVLAYLEDNELVSSREFIRKKLKLPDGLARYISEYFIDQKAEFYLRCKFGTSRINDGTLGFKEWRKELAKTPKQRKEEKKLFLEELRKSRVEMVERINHQGEDEKKKKKKIILKK
jgi:hypothetical protein